MSRASTSIGREVSKAEVDAIVTRLHTAHTKSSAPVRRGGADPEPCKPYSELQMPGYGQKMFPAIPGIETRFKGAKVDREKERQVVQRLNSAATRAWDSKKAAPRVLLFPERTLLYADPERIRIYQETGQILKQNGLGTRDKWYK